MSQAEKKRQNERLKEFLKAEEEKDLQTPEGREARCFAKQYAELWKKKKSEEQYNIGLKLMDQNKFEKAIKHLSEATKLNPDNAEYHYNLGNVLHKSGKISEAIEEYRQALHLQPNYVYNVFYKCSIAYIQLGRYEKAFETCTISLVHSIYAIATFTY